MNPIRKIIVTGDVLRVGHAGQGTQNVNIRWLQHLLAPALRMLTDTPLEMLLHESAAGNLAHDFYRRNELQMCVRNWVELYARPPSPEDLEKISAAFQGALVLAFELPEIIRAGLAKAGIPYVDFTIHPLRFLDDVPFGVRSNIPGVQQALQEWVLTAQEISIGAGLAMSTLTRLPPPAGCEQADGWALFACQTLDDKVLIRDGRLMQAADFLDAFAAMAARHPRILVKPHPAAAGGAPTKLLKRLFRNVCEVDANFYLLLAQPGISDVYSITSSTSIEAPYFGKRGTHFAPYPYVFSQDRLTEIEYLQVRPAIHLPQFWEPVLAATGLAVRPAPAVDKTLSPNRMRRSLRASWGADIFMTAP